MKQIIVALLVGIVYCVLADGNSVIKSCCEVATRGDSSFSTPNSQSGVYNIIDFCSHGPLIQGYCDATTNGGGWLVIQRRKLYGYLNFHRSWLEYERGFGNLNSEFWYGLRSLHCLTSKGTWELRVDFTFTNWTNSYLHYKNFAVGPANDNYRLSITGFTGITARDPFTYHALDGQQFSTYDSDNDKSSSECARKVYGSTSPGGWWYNSCFNINLNYRYRENNGGFMYLDKWYSPPYIEMKIRPTNCGQ